MKNKSHLLSLCMILNFFSLSRVSQMPVAKFYFRSRKWQINIVNYVTGKETQGKLFPYLLSIFMCCTSINGSTHMNEWFSRMQNIVIKNKTTLKHRINIKARTTITIFYIHRRENIFRYKIPSNNCPYHLTSILIKEGKNGCSVQRWACIPMPNQKTYGCSLK